MAGAMRSRTLSREVYIYFFSLVFFFFLKMDQEESVYNHTVGTFIHLVEVSAISEETSTIYSRYNCAI